MQVTLAVSLVGIQSVNLQIISQPAGMAGDLSLEPHLVQESECSRIPVLNPFNIDT